MKSNPNSISVLNFRTLEDVFNLDKKERERSLSEKDIFRIGPLVEYIFQTKISALDRFQNNEVAYELRRVLNVNKFSDMPVTTRFNSKDFEFYKCYENDSEQMDARWISFCKRFESAAINTGLDREFARALVGTFGEMTGNLIDHSGLNSGIVGYRWNHEEFEYVVADKGMGVLNSLRTNSQYSKLRDSGEALITALETGESRYGNKSGHGFGFRTLISNIASRNSYLRFRSGDHVHTIDGTGYSIMRRTKSVSNYNGFLISVVCKNSSEYFA